MIKQELLNLIRTKGIKMEVTPEQSRQVQELCFEEGIYWPVIDSNIQFSDMKHLYINKRHGIKYANDDNWFKNSDKYQVSANEFIKIMEKKEMKLSDLKTGDKVIERSGSEKIVIRYDERICFEGHTSFNRGKDYDDAMKNKYFPEHDIMKVERCNDIIPVSVFFAKNYSKLWHTIYERDEKQEQIDVIKAKIKELECEVEKLEAE